MIIATNRPPVQVVAQTTAVNDTASSSSSSSSSPVSTTPDGSQLRPEPETVTTKIAFGSCHKNHLASSPTTIWETIAKTETVAHRHRFISPRDNNDNGDGDAGGDSDHSEDGNLILAVRPLDAWIWTGDAIYPPHRDPITHKKTYREATLEEMKDSLDEMKYYNESIGYKQFTEGTFEHNYWNDTENNSNNYSIPPPKHIYGVWDDHDWGGNDFGNRMPQQEERKQIFMDFLGYPRRSGTDGSENEKQFKEILPSSRSGFYHSIEITEDPFPSKYYGMSPSIIDDYTETINRQMKEKRNKDTRGGKIKVIMLDTRSQREDHCIPSVGQSIPLGAVVACLTRWVTSGLLLYKYAGLWGYEGCEHNKILNDDQWSWLEQELLGSSQSRSDNSATDADTPDLYVIVSSIQVWSTNPATESWGQFPDEQERLWNLLRQYYGTNRSTTSASSSPSHEKEQTQQQQQHRAPVVFLSGDVHHAEISGQPGWFDVTSSGLTHHCGQHKLYGWTSKAVLESFPKHRYQSKHNFFIGLNYGVLQVDWDRRTYQVLVKDSNGDEVLGISQSLDDPPPLMPPYKDLPHTWDGHLIPYAKKLMWCLIGGAVAIVFSINALYT